MPHHQQQAGGGLFPRDCLMTEIPKTLIERRQRNPCFQCSSPLTSGRNCWMSTNNLQGLLSSQHFTTTNIDHSSLLNRKNSISVSTMIRSSFPSPLVVLGGSGQSLAATLPRGGCGGGGTTTTVATVIRQWLATTSTAIWSRPTAIGETLIVSILLVAFFQGLVTLVQYRTNPKGQLKVPPGRTYGVQHPQSPSTAQSRYLEHKDFDDFDMDVTVDDALDQNVVPVTSTTHLGDTTSSATTTKTNLNDNDHDRDQHHFLETVNNNNDDGNNQTSALSSAAATTTTTTSSSSRGLHVLLQRRLPSPRQVLDQINRWLFILIPWTSQRIIFLFERNAQLFHLGTAMTMVAIWDIPHQLWFLLQDRRKQQQQQKQHLQRQVQEILGQEVNTTAPIITATTTTTIAEVTTTNSPIYPKDNVKSTSTATTRPSDNKGKDIWRSPSHSLVGRDQPEYLPTTTATTTPREQRLLVIGDSLAVGLGSLNVFDEDKKNSIPFYRIENIEGMEDTGTNFQWRKNINSTNRTNNHNRSVSGNHNQEVEHTGPIFPHRLAQTLANQWQVPVQWRSAGVDGGTIQSIETYCLGVLEEEVIRGQPPDIIVVLCGSNDLKTFLSHPLQRDHWPRGYKFRLKRFLQTMLTVAPNATIVLPSVATQMFHKHSPLNMFPLVMVLDILVGVWDFQKKLVTHQFLPHQVLYVSVQPSEIYEWYRNERPQQRSRHHTTHQNNHQQEQEQQQARTNVIKTTQVPVQDVPPIFHPAIPTGINLDRDNSSNDDLSLIAADGIHPNGRCYDCWANNIGIKLSRLSFLCKT